MNPVKDKERATITMHWQEAYPDREPFITMGLAGVLHMGIDLAPTNKKDILMIVAPVDGVVVEADVWMPPSKDSKDCSKYLNKHPFGNLVKIKSTSSDKNYVHYLAHMFSIVVKKGMKVKKGDPIGIMGSTGKSTATHLHYGVKTTAGLWADPSKYLT